MELLREGEIIDETHGLSHNEFDAGESFQLWTLRWWIVQKLKRQNPVSEPIPADDTDQDFAGIGQAVH
jgi:hypothetical protein